MTRVDHEIDVLERRVDALEARLREREAQFAELAAEVRRLCLATQEGLWKATVFGGTLDQAREIDADFRAAMEPKP